MSSHTNGCTVYCAHKASPLCKPRGHIVKTSKTPIRKPNLSPNFNRGCKGGIEWLFRCKWSKCFFPSKNSKWLNGCLNPKQWWWCHFSVFVFVLIWTWAWPYRHWWPLIRSVQRRHETLVLKEDYPAGLTLPALSEIRSKWGLCAEVNWTVSAFWGGMKPFRHSGLRRPGKGLLLCTAIGRATGRGSAGDPHSPAQRQNSSRSRLKPVKAEDGVDPWANRAP